MRVSKKGDAARPSELIVGRQLFSQKKNSYFVWYMLFLVEAGVFREVTLKFLISGHTNNPCDRGFRYVKKHVGKHACWTM